MKTFKQFMEELEVNDFQMKVANSNKFHALVHMHPQKFLQMTTKDAAHMKQIMDDAQPLHKYNEYTRTGSTYNAPSLKIDKHPDLRGFHKVVSHEGRHRAAALLKAGHTTMPVFIKAPHHDGVPERQHGFEHVPEVIHGQVGKGVMLKSDMKLIKDRTAV